TASSSSARTRPAAEPLALRTGGHRSSGRRALDLVARGAGRADRGRARPSMGDRAARAALERGGVVQGVRSGPGARAATDRRAFAALARPGRGGARLRRAARLAPARGRGDTALVDREPARAVGGDAPALRRAPARGDGARGRPPRAPDARPPAVATAAA